MTMPAGQYYVGDLCYVMTDKEWDEYCSITISNNHCLDGEFEMKDGRRFATYGTAWGDGLYRDQYRNEYSVDSGSIGCIKLEDITAEKYKVFGKDIEDLGAIHTFEYEFTTSGFRGKKEWDGVICIGGVKIETDPEDFDGDYDE